MIANFLRRLRAKRLLDKALRERKLARLARAEAARRGVSTEIKRRAAKSREVFGQ